MNFAFALLLSALPTGLTDTLDAAWAARTPANRTATAKAQVKILRPHATEFEAAWRLARALCWVADDKPYYADLAQRSKLGQEAMKHAAAAIKLQPGRVEGHYYRAWAVGQWSLGISIVKALWQGAEGELVTAMTAAQKIDSSFDQFGILRMWGRYHHALPWPKKDTVASLRFLREAKTRTPSNLRTYVFLAEAYIANGEPKKAMIIVNAGLKRRGNERLEPDHDLWHGELKRLKKTDCAELLEHL